MVDEMKEVEWRKNEWDYEKKDKREESAEQYNLRSKKNIISKIEDPGSSNSNMKLTAVSLIN